MRHCDVRCDQKQYDSFEKDVDLYSKFYRKTPYHQVQEHCGEADVHGWRSPDAQCAIQRLVRHMSKPTKHLFIFFWNRWIWCEDGGEKEGPVHDRFFEILKKWAQQKECDKILSVAPIPTDLNSADIGAKTC